MESLALYPVRWLALCLFEIAIYEADEAITAYIRCLYSKKKSQTLRVYTTVILQIE